MDTNITTAPPNKKSKDIPFEDVVEVKPLRTLSLDLKELEDRKKGIKKDASGFMSILLGEQNHPTPPKKAPIVQNNMTNEEVQNKVRSILEQRGQMSAPPKEEEVKQPVAPVKDSVSLGGVTIEGENVKVIYSKNFDPFVYLMDENNNLVHSEKFFGVRGTNVQSIQLLKNFRMNPGQKVKLCHGNNNKICSGLVTVLGKKPEVVSVPPVVTAPKPVAPVSTPIPARQPISPVSSTPGEVKFEPIKFTTDSMKSLRKQEYKIEEESEEDINTLKEKVKKIDEEMEKLQRSFNSATAQKNKSKAEESQILRKKDEIEKVLSPILMEKRNIDQMIKQMEDEELVSPIGDKKRMIEQKRWELEDNRKKVEQKKWAALDDMQITTRLLEEIQGVLSKVTAEEKELTDKINNFTKEREEKKLKIKLHDVREIKKDVDTAISKAMQEVERIQSVVGKLNQQEQEMSLKKKDVELRESLDLNVLDQKKIAQERWEIEAKLRQVEKERWSAEIEQSKAEKSLETLKEGESSILRQEQELIGKTQVVKVPPPPMHKKLEFHRTTDVLDQGDSL